MTRVSPSNPDWVEPLCRIAMEYMVKDVSIRDLFQRAAPNLNDPHLVERVLKRLEAQPELCQAWQQYSYDKRGTPSPFLDGLKVGFAATVDEKVVIRGVHTYETPAEACAHFIAREAHWILEGRAMT